ncbi:QacE family quaternary ammonium compound efflux SMR transporter [Bacillus mangrovi]|uniref:QacE family quaternary ammonium compound efflux SMR transporter n=1 Tax=Metabacillus mangrovi TaxID=1491830 RepID=A0A7X2S5H8_9BACI|nr:multidrug efflux SMR transporter [Metabacillus mangrovi]MTH53605.1 QacE family quaternary ammonium compound efflux SMR transporter [Metabacillus mangrovi]
MAWFYVIAAGIFEMLGVLMLNRVAKKQSFINFLLLAVALGTSFTLLSASMQTLPMGTAYSIWTGIGAAGGAILGMILYGESKDWKRIFFIALILSATIGLKLVS